MCLWLHRGSRKHRDLGIIFEGWHAVNTVRGTLQSQVQALFSSASCTTLSFTTLLVPCMINNYDFSCLKPEWEINEKKMKEKSLCNSKAFFKVGHVVNIYRANTKVFFIFFIVGLACLLVIPLRLLKSCVSISGMMMIAPALHQSRD